MSGEGLAVADHACACVRMCTGQLRETCSPLEEFVTSFGAGGQSEDGSAAAGSQASTPPQQHVGISSMQYCDRSKLLVLVLQDGSCAMCGTSFGGHAPLSQVAFSYWVCFADKQATCAKIGASAQMVAVGCADGMVVLYRSVLVRWQ